jgi:hypothetical protein
MIDELLLCDHLTRTLGKVDQDVEGPAAKGQHHTVAPKHPLANRKFKRAESQLPVNYGAMHVSAKPWISPTLYAYRRSANAAIVRA